MDCGLFLGLWCYQVEVGVVCDEVFVVFVGEGFCVLVVGQQVVGKFGVEVVDLSWQCGIVGQGYDDVDVFVFFVFEGIQLCLCCGVYVVVELVCYLVVGCGLQIWIVLVMYGVVVVVGQ